MFEWLLERIQRHRKSKLCYSLPYIGARGDPRKYKSFQNIFIFGLIHV